ncbi:MAG TPA: hypothetical protein VH374_12950 [Polyangia bacterium]|jgi:hypothetical protein|nr:hypothetical protein [Polyangia bacterium]
MKRCSLGTGKIALALLALALILVPALATGCGSSSAGGGSGGAPGGDAAAGTGGASGGGGTCSTCFVHGNWKIDNLSPCFLSTTPADGGAATLTTVTSTVTSGGASMCPDPAATTLPSWSTDTLTTDCPGRYHLCITLKAGNGKTPANDDCTVVQDCADGDYTTATQAQTWAGLPGWKIDPANLACAQKFQDQGGYAQLTATGTATNCGAVTRALGTITYCPLSCQSDPTGPGCTTCVAGGSGSF